MSNLKPRQSFGDLLDWFLLPTCLQCELNLKQFFENSEWSSALVSGSAINSTDVSNAAGVPATSAGVLCTGLNLLPGSWISDNWLQVLNPSLPSICTRVLFVYGALLSAFWNAKYVVHVLGNTTSLQWLKYYFSFTLPCISFKTTG